MIIDSYHGYKEIQKTADVSGGVKRLNTVMTPPTTPLKKQRPNESSYANVLATPASGRVFSIASSPTTRHIQSPKYVREMEWCV